MSIGQNKDPNLEEQVIEEESDEEGSKISEKSFQMFDPYAMKMMTSPKKKSKKHGVKRKIKPSLVRLLESSITTDFLCLVSEFFPTSELVKFRRISKLFDSSLKVYLPIRLQQEAEFINAYLESYEDLNSKYLKFVDT